MPGHCWISVTQIGSDKVFVFVDFLQLIPIYSSINYTASVPCVKVHVYVNMLIEKATQQSVQHLTSETSPKLTFWTSLTNTVKYTQLADSKCQKKTAIIYPAELAVRQMK